MMNNPAACSAKVCYTLYNPVYVQEVKRRGLKAVVAGIPKTIDNDIPVIDKSFGFDTAVEEAQRAINAAHVEAESAENGIGVVKLMGRNSGMPLTDSDSDSATHRFIAMYATLVSRDVDLCLIPESLKKCFISVTSQEEHQAGGSKSSNTGVIVGSVIVGCVLLALLVVDGLYAFPLWDANNGSGAIPQLKGEKEFTFAEVNRYTNKFPETNNIGTGGYGMVVASMDWPQVTKYKALVSAVTQAGIINYLYTTSTDPKRGVIHGGLIMELLISLKKSTGHEPHRIIFYRDGVSEGQFNEVLLYEMDKISKVFLLSTLIIIKHVKSAYVPFFNKYSWLIHPGLSFTGRKLHATCNIHCGSEEASYSFLPGDRGSTDKSGNVLPGTVLDTKICHPTEFDFYCVVMLVSRQREMENPCYRKLKQKSNGSLLETESEVKDCISRTCSRSKLIEYAEEVSPLCTKLEQKDKYVDRQRM
ncbi:PAZ domain-containing protein [Tanacetum coccineum]